MPKHLEIVRDRTTPLSDLISDYLTGCRARGLSEATLAGNYAFVLQRILLPWCEANDISRVEQLDEKALNRFAVELMTNGGLRGKPLSKHSVRTYIRPVRFMLTWAERAGEDVQAKPTIPRVGKQFRDVLSRGEIEKIEAAANSERDKLIIRLFADCGLRLNELTKLRCSDIRRTDHQGMLLIHGKGNRDRRVPVPPALLRGIQRHIEARSEARPEDYIFIAKRRSAYGTFEPLKGSGIEQMVRWTARRAGISRSVHPHLFRHSWMTEMLRREMNPIQLSVIAGASQSVIAQYYEHLNQDDAYDAMMRAWTK